jgi:hypothetical protein
VHLVFFTAIRSLTENEKGKNQVGPLGPNVRGKNIPIIPKLFVCTIMYCCFGVVFYINMCIVMLKFDLLKQKKQKSIGNLFTALTSPVTALTDRYTKNTV